jgi:hypothetical protein
MPCADIAPTLAGGAFVVVTAPVAAARVTSPLVVRGCSRTFESNVAWEIHGRDGRVLASGFTAGGGVDGPAAFEFSADFAVPRAEVGRLEVFEIDASDGEGFPPPRTVLPVVLAPDEG